MKTKQQILKQIRKNEQVYAQANELIDKLNDFIKDTTSEVLKLAITELEEIADSEYLENKRVFEDFKKKIGEMKKPPIGLMPQKIHDLKRLESIIEAIRRYIQECEPIPIQWIEEYNELARKCYPNG